MIWVRKGIFHLLSLLLLATLLGTAFSTGANQTLGKPKKIETYLAQSKLYDHFVAYAADQAKKSEGGNDQSGSVSLSDTAVQTAAQSAFSAQVIQNSVNTFINANYAWLEGKTATPNFNIDLSSQKASFAQKVGQYAKTYSATLPVCSAAEAVQQQNADPLLATCRPAETTPDAIGAQVTERLSTTGDFLSNPVITANSVNPKGNQQNKPYYSKLSRLPKLYQIGTKLPYILGVLSILLAMGTVFTALTRRRGVRRVGVVLAIAGVVLIASKFIADFVLKKVENQVFNSSSVGQLQKSLTDFAQRVESAMVKIDLWFGIAFVVLALMIFGILMRTRQKDGKGSGKAGPEETAEPENGQLPLIKARKRLRRPFGDSIMPLGAKPGGETGASEPPKRKKRPRLIQ